MEICAHFTTLYLIVASGKNVLILPSLILLEKLADKEILSLIL